MPSTAVSLIETLRANLHAHVDAALDDALQRLSSANVDDAISFKDPTIEDGHDPRNKNGLNLTPRGVEILYRVFDKGGGYNKAAKMLKITQGAAKNRKAIWTKLGGINRKKQVLDIDK